MTRMTRVLAAALALLAATSVAAQYPNRSLKMVVPFPPGGATDVIGRVLAERLAKALGQPVVVENRGGAGGNIGAEVVAKSPADGYTLLLGAMTSHSIMATLEKESIRYNLEKDLQSVTIAASVPLVWVVHPSVPAKTLKEFVAYAKANPGKLTYASSGAGAPQRMGAELLRKAEGLDMIHVPYKGSGPAMTDLVSGQVTSMAETVPASLQFIKAGRLRALAVTTPQRISMLPDVPTTSEAGKILQTPEAQEQLLAQGAYAVSTTPAEAQARLHEEITRWARVVKEANVRPD
jgi:tripartite-type tricarboxylate transporter receptor subunit TctC